MLGSTLQKALLAACLVRPEHFLWKELLVALIVLPVRILLAVKQALALFVPKEPFLRKHRLHAPDVCRASFRQMVLLPAVNVQQENTLPKERAFA